MTLSELAKESWAVAEEKGLHAGRSMAGRDDTLIRLGLVHTEVSEAMQVVKRHGLTTPEAVTDLAEELADVLIRVGDVAKCVGIDLTIAVRQKMAKNRTRPRFFGTPLEAKQS